jgi:arsenate reductase (glutaredoxin)
MKVKENELLVFYNPNSSLGTQTLAYAKSVTPNLKTIECDKNTLTGKQWKEMLEKINLAPEEVINKQHPVYRDKLENAKMSEEDWLVVLKNEPDLLKAPIAINSDTGILCKNANDILKLKMNIKPDDASDKFNA